MSATLLPLSVRFTARSLIEIMKKVKIVFQGDSVTDAGRDKRNYHHMGNGYAKFASELIAEAHPDVEFEFINFGIGGNRTSELFDRFYADALVFEPDVISILIGVNDVWHRHDAHHIATTDAQTETNYRALLERIKRESNAKILMMTPYILDHESVQHMRGEVDAINVFIKELAAEFADAFVPLDELFAEALKTQPQPLYYSADGVHPNENGAKFIAKHYAEAMSKLI